MKRGILGKWYLARQTVERYDIEIKKGDKAILYQPAEVRGKTRRAGHNYIGNFTVDSEPFIQSRGEESYSINIIDFKLWQTFVSKNEEESLDTEIPRGSEFGRLIHTQMIIPIDKEDYELIIIRYGENVEQEF